jgi:hypothetical protein
MLRFVGYCALALALALPLRTKPFLLRLVRSRIQVLAVDSVFSWERQELPATLFRFPRVEAIGLA